MLDAVFFDGGLNNPHIGITGVFLQSRSEQQPRRQDRGEVKINQDAAGEEHHEA